MMNTSETIDTVFQALSDPTRLAVISRLGAGAASTKELAQPFDMALPSFMQHLDVLEKSGLITSQKVGRVRTWQIQQEEFAAVESWLAEQRRLWEERTDRLANFVEELARIEREMSDTNNEFTVRRIIKAPRHLVWKAWTVPQYLEKWWCPAPMTCTVTHLDPAPGGSFDLLMRDPSGQEMPQTGAFLKLLNEEQIIFTTALTNEWRPAENPYPITAIISMRDHVEGTEYTTRVLYRDEEERRQMEGMNFEAGWTLAIDQLESMLANWED